MPSTISTKLRSAYVVVAVGLLRLATRQAGRRFYEMLDRPDQAQDRLLDQLLGKLARTEYGQRLGVLGNENYDGFRRKVPLQTYEDMAPWLARQRATGKAIVTPDRVVHLEPTSGSSGDRKSIPYTRPLLRSFSNMFRVWAHDLLCHGPEIKSGRIFISVSPAGDDDRIQNDLDYLDQPLKLLLAPFLVSPPSVDAKDYLHDLALTLLRARDLEIISIWSPSYLLAVLDHIRAHRTVLASQLDSPARERLLENPLCWERVWSQLNFISCWDDAMSAPLAEQIRGQFPNVVVQGKGLLATEAPLTVPITGVTGGVPLLGEVFFEFETQGGEIKRLHELLAGKRYKLIISQAAGLTRYRLDDVVEVQARCKNTPTLSFVGRAEQVCDLVGEKLNEIFVRQSLEVLLPGGCFILVPQRTGYVLLADSGTVELARRADEALCRAHHYALARRQGQLAPLRTLTVPDLLARLQAFHQARGTRPGDIKHSALITDPEQGRQLLAHCGNNQVVQAVQSTV